MRGQAHTLEAFVAALLVISGVAFALHAVAVTPLSASTSNQHIQNQQRLMANDLLATTAKNDTLEEAILFWNTTWNRFQNTGDRGYYTNGGPPLQFGRLLNRTFREDRVAFNVFVDFREDGSRSTQRLVYMGSPSTNSVTVTRSVTVYDDTSLTAGNGTTLAAANASGSFYAPDIAPDAQLFNVMEVRMVLWRM